MLQTVARISLFTLALTPLAQAEETTAPEPKEDDRGFYLGIKGGQTNIDVSYYDDDNGIGFVAGYDFGGFALEFEHTETEGDFSYGFPTYYGYANIERDYELETNALYGVYRSPGAGYIKVKLGILNEDITLSGAGSNINEDDTGASAGIGAGVRIDSFSLEFEYTIIEEDASFISLGANYTF